MTRVAVLGASGFVGSAVTAALRGRGAEVVEVRSPRLTTPARRADAIRADLPRHRETSAALSRRFREVDVVVNAAGAPAPSGRADDVLFGANALLPAVLAAACSEADVRLVHVSSAAVQGRRPLDETGRTAPFSPYSRAKALGEELAADHRDTVLFRPTSVQGPGRGVTRSLVRFARSPLASVAAPGDDPTPQVLLANVADAVAYVAMAETPPPVVLQPSEGVTTGGLLETLGGRPRLVPRGLARAVVSLLVLLGRLGRGAGPPAALARRLEVLWFGQRQEPGWLTGRWSPVAGHEQWRSLS